MQLKPNIGSCLCIWRYIEKCVGLLKTLIQLVQLWASIISECFCGASAAIWSPTVKHNSHRAVRRLLNTKHFDTRLHGSLCMMAMWWVSWDFGLKFFWHTMQLKPNIGSCLCIWRCIEKWVGLLKTLIHLVHLWASILSECWCGVSAAFWSPTVNHNSHRLWGGFWIQNISTRCMVAMWWVSWDFGIKFF